VVGANGKPEVVIVLWEREAREEAQAWAVVATGSASVDADYDNGTGALHG